MKSSKKSKGVAADIYWCIANADTLTIQSFSEHFNYGNKSSANKRFPQILQTKRFKSNVPAAANSINQFNAWKGSQNEVGFWNNRILNLTRKSAEMRIRTSTVGALERFGVEEGRRMGSENAEINLNESTFSIVSESESPTNTTDNNSRESTPLHENENMNASFSSDDYHPTRKYKYTYENIPEWPDCQDWMIGDINISQELKQFRETSSQLTVTQGNIKDIRILSLHMIFPFMLSISNSVSKYIPQSIRALIKHELNGIYSVAPTPSIDLLVWTNTLRILKVGWIEMKKKCNEIITDAVKSNDPNNLTASFILFELVPRLTKEIDANETGEDTFVKNYIDCFFDNIFSADERFYQSWTNVVLINTSDSQYKPDWFAYVKPWIKKFTIAACEVKPPSKVGRGDISDFVKLGIEMREMLDEMLNIGVDDATVLGILIEGKQLATYAMNIKCGIYRMIQLGEFNVISTQSELGIFGALFTGLMQVKNIASDTARVIEETEREHSCGKKREHASERSSTGSTPTLKKLRPDTSPQC